MILENKQELKFRQMTEPPVSKLICKLAIPCIISMLVTSFYNMADTYFVGMLKSNAATGAVGVVFSMMAIIQAVASSLARAAATTSPGSWAGRITRKPPAWPPPGGTCTGTAPHPGSDPPGVCPDPPDPSARTAAGAWFG